MSGPKRLVLDIERTMGRFRRQYRGLDVAGDFWSLNDYKHIVGRIHADDVLEWPRTICLAWRFIGGKRVEFSSEWDDGAEAMHAAIWHAVNEADIVIGHNVKGFDMRHLRTGWRDLGLQPPSAVKVVDTLTVARREFGDESKTLDALTKRAGISSKTDRYSVAVARAALAGDKKAQRKLKKYNQGDIVASEALYFELAPWMHGHPVMALYNGGEDQCACESYDLRKQGFAFTPAGKFQQYQCKRCGSWFRGKHAIETVDLRPVAA